VSKHYIISLIAGEEAVLGNVRANIYDKCAVIRMHDVTGH